MLLPPFEHNLADPLHRNIEQPRQVADCLAICIPRPDFLIAPMFGRRMVCERECRCWLPDVEQHHPVTNPVHKALECPGINMSHRIGTFEERLRVKMPLHNGKTAKRPLMFIKEIIQCQAYPLVNLHN